MPRPSFLPRRRVVAALAAAGVAAALVVPAGAALAARSGPAAGAKHTAAGSHGGGEHGAGAKGGAEDHGGPPPAPPLGAPGGTALRWWPYGTVLHGSLTVQSREKGVVQLAIQRGTVTDVSPGSLTVKSADGVEITWTTSATTRIVPVTPGRGRGAKRAPVTVGAQVGVWGPGAGDGPEAAVILLRTTGKGGDGPSPSPSPSPTPSPEPTPTV